ncbi:hypothetical protein [Williamsia sterculiae]|uniref:Uncharacterized protein n=1 Tax=Williamsia sterculiae TaxID=1344003 RepID=A0A1N7HF42_9NOCA|nr:hypothetical protein [Williamsia sterculiae]SIS23452.1 hypothetical protein SAMN05445060_4124 [Williamsia sterculiae]
MPTRGLDHHSLADLTAAFRSAAGVDLDQLLGDHRAEFAGPLHLRLTGPLLMSATGMPHWYGKRFRPHNSDDTTLQGTNLLRRDDRITESVPMTASIRASRLDGQPALVVSYRRHAPWPWRNVNDELRPHGEATLIGLTFGIPAAPRNGAPFLLHRITR